MKPWENEFVPAGTGAITLIDHLFVVIALGAERGDEWFQNTSAAMANNG